jgi:hypothetical protein
MRKHYLLSFILLLFLSGLHAQCVISGGDNDLTQADLTTCLSNDGCPSMTSGCTILLTDGTYGIKSAINLSAYPGLTLTIASDAALKFFDNGSNNGNLIMNATSTIVVEEGGNLTSNNAGTIQITIGSTTYTGAQFPDIVAAGGANAMGVLPIELAAFSATAGKGHIKLTWMTASEINNDYMAIEHSSDGRYFEEVGQVAGAGNSQIAQSYKFIHGAPQAGTNYYRIKQVDFDGQSTYHPVIAVSFTDRESQIIAYPNPVSEVLTIQFQGEDTASSLTLVDQTGRVVSVIHTDAKSKKYELPMSLLESGVYYLRVVNDNISEWIPIQKL